MIYEMNHMCPKLCTRLKGKKPTCRKEDAHGRVLKTWRRFADVRAQQRVQEHSITTCAWSSLRTGSCTVKIFLHLKTANRWKLSLNGDGDNYPRLEKAYTCIFFFCIPTFFFVIGQLSITKRCRRQRLILLAVRIQVGSGERSPDWLGLLFILTDVSTTCVVSHPQSRRSLTQDYTHPDDHNTFFRNDSWLQTFHC